jgi:hypothetical protein
MKGKKPSDYRVIYIFLSKGFGPNCWPDLAVPLRTTAQKIMRRLATGFPPTYMLPIKSPPLQTVKGISHNPRVFSPATRWNI